jgi:hypothetical protein
MARYRGSTAERGLGAPHVADKKRLMALHRDGDPCWRCGKPMYKSQGLERDHMVDRARGGADGPAVLAHMACNRAAGARLGNRLQPRVIMAAGHDVRCGACGKPYHYAARACEVCGVHYHPSGKTVRTCSRTCGVVLRRRKYGGKQSSKKPPRRRTCDCTGPQHTCYVKISYRNCVSCDGVFVSRTGKEVACSGECRARHEADWRAAYRLANKDRLAQLARQANDRKGEARGWPRGRGAYNVGAEPWNKQASRQW